MARSNHERVGSKRRHRSGVYVMGTFNLGLGRTADHLIIDTADIPTRHHMDISTKWQPLSLFPIS